MSAILNLPTSRYNLSVELGSDLSCAGNLLRSLESTGVYIHAWTLASTELPGQLKLIADLSGDIVAIEEILFGHSAVQDCQLFEPLGAISLELALITVTACGEVQDEAASLVAGAGGRLVSLDENGFVAHLSEQPEKIESVLRRLRGMAPVEAVRSGNVTLKRPVVL